MVTALRYRSPFGSAYFQSISLGLECVFFLAGPCGNRELSIPAAFDRHEELKSQKWLRVKTKDDESLVAYLVQHAVISDSDPPDRLVILRHEASRATRSRVDLEAMQGPGDATPGAGR